MNYKLIDGVLHKKCSTCLTYKITDCFSPSKYKTKTGVKESFTSRCKFCNTNSKKIEYRKNPEKFKRKKSDYYYKNHEKVKERKNKDYKNNKEKYREQARRSYSKLKKKVIEYYGGDNPKCQCCQENHKEFLALDHKNNDGGMQRSLFKLTNTAKLYRWIIANNYPDDIQLLCHNCNMAKEIYGICPHKSEATANVLLD